jgi:uncharacterized protein (TIGR00251 family)
VRVIEDRGDGCILAVRAQPGAKKNAVLGVRNDRLRVAVQAPPDKGRANDAIVEVLAEFFGVKRSQVELVAGPTNRDKKFRLNGVRAAEVAAKIQTLAEE